jgi:hypothetical protein
VRFSGCSPLGGDPGKVLDVEGDHDGSLPGGEREAAFVVGAVEFAFLVGGADIVLSRRAVAM